jgi:hypothetical protein
MFNSSPIDEWGPTVTQFWTWAGQSGTSTGTWILTALGFIVMLVAFVWFVTLENGKLARQAEALRATGALDRPPETPATGSATG